MPTAYLAEACRVLAAGEAEVVLGPAEDGGYYLVGLGAPAPELFQDVPWGTSTVYRTTLAHLRALGRRIAVLPLWFDVDHARDLARVGREPAEAHPYRPRRTLALLGELRR